MTAAAFKALLEAGAVDALRDAWMQAAPHLPQPETREQAEITMHMARTSSAAVNFKARAWSHRWLTERDLPTQLPDDLKPRAERVYPRIVEGVGISVRASDPLLASAVIEIRKAMENAVEDAYAEGRTDPAFVKARINEARERMWRALLGERR